MHDKLFEAALGIQAPWAVTSVRFDEAAKVLTVDIACGSRYPSTCSSQSSKSAFTSKPLSKHCYRFYR